MSVTLLAPVQKAKPNIQRHTVEEFYRLMNLGLMERRFEIIDGKAISKMSQNFPHRIGVKLIQQWLLSLFDILNIQTEGPIALSGADGKYNEPEPDVAITREPITEGAGHPGPNDLLLVVEVADTSLSEDLDTKAGLYARSGIIEYWVLNLNQRQLHVHRSPVHGKYLDITIYKETDVVSIISRTDARIAVHDLLPPVRRST